MRPTLLLAVVTACRFGFEDSKRLDALEIDAESFDATVDEGDGGSMDVGGDATATVDVLPGICEPVACGASGGTCVGETCVIIAMAESAVTCPAGMPCRIECTGDGRPCRDGASCGQATACEVRCIGARACQDGASCGTALTCLVTCDGSEACESGIASGTGTCTSHCCGFEACAGGVGACTNDAVCN